MAAAAVLVGFNNISKIIQDFSQNVSQKMWRLHRRTFQKSEKSFQSIALLKILNISVTVDTAEC